MKKLFILDKKLAKTYIYYEYKLKIGKCMKITSVNSLPLSTNTPKIFTVKKTNPVFGLSDIPTKKQYNDLRVFYHHIYEYKKGLRSLVLTTEKAENRKVIESKLQRENIPYIIREVNNKNINVFFGNKNCINVVSTLDCRLDKITPEQDFMLGILLGYDKILQCKRYFVMKEKTARKN